MLPTGIDPDPTNLVDLTLPPQLVVRPLVQSLLGRSSDILAADGTTLLVPKMVESGLKDPKLVRCKVRDYPGSQGLTSKPFAQTRRYRRAAI